MAVRDRKGRFSTGKLVSRTKSARQKPEKVFMEHNYANVYMCDGDSCKTEGCADYRHLDLPRNVDRSGWGKGRRVIELGLLLEGLRFCSKCRLGPVPLTIFNVVGEMKKGLGGYFYVVCQNHECNHVNRVPYGKTHRVKRQGMPCFVANTKLGTAMIDSIGGSGRVNNLLSTLNMKPIHRMSLQAIERRVGELVESVANTSTRNAAKKHSGKN